MNSSSVIILDDAAPAPPPPQTDFYQRTLVRLKSLMGCFSGDSTSGPYSPARSLEHGIG